MPEDILKMKRLFPELSDKEAAEAAYQFRRYAALLIRIYSGVLADPERYQKLQRLTGEKRSATVCSKVELSNTSAMT